MCLSRNPSEMEVEILREFFQKQQRYYEANDAAEKAVVGKTPVPKGPSSAELAAWIAVGRILINMDEFITRE